jgi:hypothetical protein
LSPKTNDTAAQGSHVSIEFHRDSASAAKSITKLEIYKVAQSGDELVDTVWSGKEALSNVFIAKDQLKIPSDKFDANVSYYYLASVTSEYEGQCSFKSSKFKITA